MAGVDLFDPLSPALSRGERECSLWRAKPTASGDVSVQTFDCVGAGKPAPTSDTTWIRGRRGFAPHLPLGHTLVSLVLSAIGAGRARALGALHTTSLIFTTTPLRLCVGLRWLCEKTSGGTRCQTQRNV